MALTEQEYRSMPLHELRKAAALSEALVGEENQPPAETFVGPEPVVPLIEDHQPPADKKARCRKIIDLGDGSGVQVFEGHTWEEVSEKLAQAQFHATKLIREQKQAKLDLRTPDVQVLPTQIQRRQLTADQRLKLSTLLVTDPKAAELELSKALFGLSPEEVQQIERDAVAGGEAIKFYLSHPDYIVCPKNRENMSAYINKYLNGVLSENNFGIAYDNLKANGLLELKEVAAPETTPQERIAPRGSGKGTRSGMSAQNGEPSRETPAPPTPSEVERTLRTMPLDKLRRIANNEGQRRT